MPLSTVQFNGCLLGSGAANGNSNFTVGLTGQTLVRETSLSGEECIFDFDELEPISALAGAPRSDSTLFSPSPAAAAAADCILNDVLNGRRGGSREVAVIHGAQKETVSGVFHTVVYGLVEGLRAATAQDTRDNGTWRTEAKYSLVRIYSWGATDVLSSTPVSQSVASPAKQMVSDEAELRLTASLAASAPVLSHRIDLHDAAARKALQTVVLDSCLVPQGHSAVCFTLTLRHFPCPEVEGETKTYCICLLPSLSRVNRLFRKELICFSHVLRMPVDERASEEWRERVDSSALASFLLGYRDYTGGHVPTAVRMVTVVEDVFSLLEENTMHCWFGSRSSSMGSLLPAWRDATETPERAGSAQLGARYSTPRLSTALVAPRGTGAAEDGEDGGRSSTVSRPRGSIEQLASLRERTRAEVTDLARTCDTLRSEVQELTDEVFSLVSVKEALEAEVSELLARMNDAVEEMETHETGMLTEVRRAEQMLSLSATSATAQESKLLERLTAVVVAHQVGSTDATPSILSPGPAPAPA